jgi:DNA polymerase-3 subunit delta'
MKAKNKKEINITLLPKDSEFFIGHANAVETITQIIDSGRMPQSWLISGPKGVGKATLAYRFARGLLAGQNDLQVSANHPVFARISKNSHSDLLVIEPDSESASGEIKVDDIRKINDFLRMTSSETKYRIVIIDSADDMNTNAANALLKLLEEPPVGALFFLISHSAGRLLPTIKSRCRNLKLHELSSSDAAQVLKIATPDMSRDDIEQIIELSGGSAGIAAWLYYNEGLKIYDLITSILSDVPNIKPAKVGQLSAIVASKDDKVLWNVMVFLLDSILARTIRNTALSASFPLALSAEQNIKNKLIVEKPLEELIKMWEKIKSVVADTDRINLDKKAVIISIFEEFNF